MGLQGDREEPYRVFCGLGASDQPRNSDICFGCDVPEETKEEIASHLRVTITSCHQKYFDLPTFTGRRKKELIAFARGRIWNKIMSWSGLWFSLDGKEVFIKLIHQAILSYMESCFGFSRILSETFIMASFWWGIYDGKQKTHW